MGEGVGKSSSSSQQEQANHGAPGRAELDMQIYNVQLLLLAQHSQSSTVYVEIPRAS